MMRRHFASLAFKIMSDPYVGTFDLSCVFIPGQLKSGSFVYNSSKAV